MDGDSRWIWADLIAFDNTLPDFGLDAYLEVCGFVPDVVSVFLYNTEFVHGHVEPNEDRLLPPDCCSYGGHPHGYLRPRQEWTAGQLHEFIAALRERGVAPYLSLMDAFRTPGWLGEHPELWQVRRDGAVSHAVCPFKRLADGSWWEDFFAGKLAQAMADCGFAGFHQADGLSHTRLPLWRGDYSADMVEQFENAGVDLPDDLPRGDTPQEMEPRADWIWRERRREWIAFWVERTTRFCRKVADAVHGVGGKVVLNNALTRDPFEAIYRFGVDYRQLNPFVDGWIAETVAPAVTIGAESGMVGDPRHTFRAMLLQMSAMAGDKPVWCLNGVHDAHEQWDVLRHGPALMEREITGHGSLFHWRSIGLRRASAGPVVCLGDGLAPHEWAWLNQWWARAVELRPERLRGWTLVWSEAAVEAELEAYLASRRISSNQLLGELIGRGAPVQAVVRVEDVAAASGPLLVLHPGDFGIEALEAVARTGQMVCWLGALPETAGDGLGCVLFGGPEATAADEPPALPENLVGLPEPPTYVQDLWFAPVGPDFLDRCASLLRTAVDTPRVLIEPDRVHAQILERDDAHRRVILTNDKPLYVVTQVDVGEPLTAVELVGEFPKTPPSFDGTKLRIRVPPNGVIVLDVTVTGDGA